MRAYFCSACTQPHTNGDPDVNDFYTSTLCDLIAIPSQSSREEDVAAYIFDFLKAAGVDVEKDRDQNVTAVVGDGDDVLHINGHMDTVQPVDDWTRDPLKPTIEDGLVYGLGASDMKGGLTVMMDLARKVKPRVRTVFSFTVCEEGSGGGDKANGVRAVVGRWPGRWAITVEGSVRDGRVTLGLGTQGHSLSRVRVRGVSAHSSRPEMGRNAIHDAGTIVERVARLNETYQEVPIFADVVGRPSMATTLISGGTAGNIIPDRCELTISRRLAPGERVEQFQKELADLTEGTEAEYNAAGGDPAACVDVNGPLFQCARQTASGLLGYEAYSFPRGRTDLVIFAKHGMDVMNIGPGIMGQAHIADEYCRIEDMATVSRLLQRIIESL